MNNLALQLLEPALQDLHSAHTAAASNPKQQLKIAFKILSYLSHSPILRLLGITSKSQVQTPNHLQLLAATLVVLALETLKSAQAAETDPEARLKLSCRSLSYLSRSTILRLLAIPTEPLKIQDPKLEIQTLRTICLSRHRDDKPPATIATETHLPLELVTRHLHNLTATRICLSRNVPTDQIATKLRCTPSKAAEYVQIEQDLKAIGRGYSVVVPPSLDE